MCEVVAEEDKKKMETRLATETLDVGLAMCMESGVNQYIRIY